MASLPPQRPQRTSPNRHETSDESSQQQDRRDSQEFSSTTSIDSQTVLLEGPSRQDTKDVSEQDSTASAQAQHGPTPPQNEEEPRRCWICFSDETEDTTPRTWRHPCACALTAHESCLLDWIADIESPAANASTSHQREIKCPQCKSDIQLARPRERFVDFASNFETAARKALLPASVATVLYGVLLTSSHHGAHTIRTIFGDHDANMILRPISQNPRDWNVIEQQAVARFPDIFRPLLREWRGLRVELGLPLIPLSLILSRTRHGDFALPILTIAFFATHPVASQTITPGYWPPSAALSLVLLPYFRSLYNEGMEWAWGEKERAWAKEVRPTLGSGEGDAGGDGDAAAAPDDADVNEVIQIQVDLDLGGDGDEDEDVEEEEEVVDVPASPATQQAEDDSQVEEDDTFATAQTDEIPDPAVPPQQAAPAPAGQQHQQQGQQQQQQRQQQRQQVDRNIDLFSFVNNAAEGVFGALVFPSIAAMTGEVMKLLLPRSWTNVPRNARIPTGLLQTKWGRSILGGCLFVVLKDAVRIYCRWRMAVSFRQRRVKDYDKVRGEYV